MCLMNGKLTNECGEHPWAVGITKTCEVLGRFATHDEGSAFIGTLENHDDGRYYLDGPPDDDPEPAFCPTCGAEEHTELGSLGKILWLRCRRCGTDFQADSP